MIQTKEDHHGRGYSGRSLKDAIRVDAAELRGHVDEVVRSSVEETLNALLEAEADSDLRRPTLRALAGAGRYAGWPLRAASWRPRPAR